VLPSVQQADSSKLLCDVFGKPDIVQFRRKIIVLPRKHIRGITSEQFWRIPPAKMRYLLWQMRDIALAKCKQEYPDCTLAQPVFKNNVWIYEENSLSPGQVLLVFHTQVSREHLHLHANILAQKDGHEILTANSPISELGVPKSISMTWQQVFMLTYSVEKSPSEFFTKWKRTQWKSDGHHDVPPSS